ncbi:hypothetical protein CPC08DRAFT_729140 [Agrocybe pediades]|nr:hypothetical protein CPC08DRAFT_729140 [Agrocybe pediades]
MAITSSPGCLVGHGTQLGSITISDRLIWTAKRLFGNGSTGGKSVQNMEGSTHIQDNDRTSIHFPHRPASENIPLNNQHRTPFLIITVGLDDYDDRASPIAILKLASPTHSSDVCRYSTRATVKCLLAQQNLKQSHTRLALDLDAGYEADRDINLYLRKRFAQVNDDFDNGASGRKLDSSWPMGRRSSTGWSKLSGNRSLRIDELSTVCIALQWAWAAAGEARSELASHFRWQFRSSPVPRITQRDYSATPQILFLSFAMAGGYKQQQVDSQSG